jgi:hypothetical protein
MSAHAASPDCYTAIYAQTSGGILFFPRPCYLTRIGVEEWLIVVRAVESLLSAGGSAPGVEHVASADVMTPADRYQELFVAVQSSGVFKDSKDFVDCTPLRHPEEIMRDYRKFSTDEGFHLAEFVQENFVHEPLEAHHYVSEPHQPLSAHIDDLWTILTPKPRRSSETFVAFAVALRLYRSWWPVQRALLLGFLFYDAWSGGEWANAPFTRNGGQFLIYY